MKEFNTTERQVGFLTAFVATVGLDLKAIDLDLKTADVVEALKRVEFIRRQCDHVASNCHQTRAGFREGDTPFAG